MDKLGQSSEIFVISFSRAKTLTRWKFVWQVTSLIHGLDWVIPEGHMAQRHSESSKALESWVQIPAQSAIPWAGFLTSGSWGSNKECTDGTGITTQHAMNSIVKTRKTQATPTLSYKLLEDGEYLSLVPLVTADSTFIQQTFSGMNVQ